MNTKAIAEAAVIESTPEQQGWTEISLEEIEELGIDPWDPSMGDTDEAAPQHEEQSS